MQTKLKEINAQVEDYREKILELERDREQGVALLKGKIQQMDEDRKRILQEVKDTRQGKEELEEINRQFKQRVGLMAEEVETLRLQHQQRIEELGFYKEQNNDLNGRLEANKDRIAYLEETLRSTEDKTRQDESTNTKEVKVDSSRVPTFNRNVFTQDDDTKSLKNKQE